MVSLQIVKIFLLIHLSSMRTHKIISGNIFLFFFVFFSTLLSSCSSDSGTSQPSDIKGTKIIFLHHSTGDRIIKGDQSNIINKIRYKIKKETAVSRWFNDYNKKKKKNFFFTDRFFPAASPYGWKNYPFDYYNIWVKHAGDKPYMKEPTLEMLTREYDVIIWKHCFPVSDILPDTGTPDINSEKKTLGNYKLQYDALKEKMHRFPETKFIVWTGAALVKGATTKEKALRAKAFFDWVRSSWDEPDDNIYLWDFYQLETEGGLYLKDENAYSSTNSHPGPAFSKRVYPLFCQRIVDVIENNGTKTKLTGEKK